MVDLLFKEEISPFTNYIQHFKTPDPAFTSRIHDIIKQESSKYLDITEAWKEYDLLDTWEYKEIKELRDLFEAALEHYLNSRGLKSTYHKLQSWCNIRGRTSRHPAHIHAFTSIVLNYYVSTPKGSGIVFHNPVKAMSYIEWADKYAPFEYTIWAEPGMLLASPGWVVHEVPYTSEEGDRVSISVNVVDLEVSYV